MPLRKSIGARAIAVNVGTTGPPTKAGFTYLGFPRGQVDAGQDFLSEVCYVSDAAIAGTSIRVTQRNAAGTLQNDITTPSTTTAQGVAVDATLSTNTVNTGVNFPWPLTAGDTIMVTAVTGTAQVVNVTFTYYQKGT